VEVTGIIACPQGRRKAGKCGLRDCKGEDQRLENKAQGSGLAGASAKTARFPEFAYFFANLEKQCFSEDATPAAFPETTA
jgi:hypothetical protein